MKIAVFNTKPHDKEYLSSANEKYKFEIRFFKEQLNKNTAPLSKGFNCVCSFVNDELNKDTIEILSQNEIKVIAMRCAGINNVDINYANEKQIKVANVPNYSPHAVAEHTIGLILALNRKIYKAYNQVREGDFSIENLLGFDMYGKTVGIIGTGKIGYQVVKILIGFGCNVIAYDNRENQECNALGVKYVSLQELMKQSDIITLHCPLIKENKHLINKNTISYCKNGVMIINTSRGGLINTNDMIEGLKSGKIGYLGLDVYEEEEKIFFQDLSIQVLQDDVFARLLTFPNVLITSHQAFFTKEAITTISETTLKNIDQIDRNEDCKNIVRPR